MDLIDMSAFYIYVFSRNILLWLDTAYSTQVNVSKKNLKDVTYSFLKMQLQTRLVCITSEDNLNDLFITVAESSRLDGW